VRFYIKEPMLTENNCDLSFCAILASAEHIAKQIQSDGGGVISEQSKADVAASFQSAVLNHLQITLNKAINWCKWQLRQKVNELVVAGGVARNVAIRNRVISVAKDLDMKAIFPSPRLCANNGVMIAWAGLKRIQLGMADYVTKESISPVWPLDKSGRVAFPEVRKPINSYKYIVRKGHREDQGNKMNCKDMNEE